MLVIVVGGNGFIGSHVSASLAKRGRETLIVSHSTPRPSIVRLPKVRVMSPDLFASQIGSAEIGRASAIVYLASKSVPSTFANQPWREISSNVEPATEFFFRCGQINPMAKLVLVSSGGTIYGRVGSCLVTERTPPAPISSYGMGKLMIEEALRFSARVTGVAFNILRVSNPVGIYQSSNAQGIVSIALRMLVEDQTFSVFGDGSNTRDYIDANDVANAICSASDDRVHNAHVWNVGSGRGRTILDVINLAESVSGKKLKVVFYPERQIDVPSIVLDTTEIRLALGWEPTRNIEQSCAEIWQQLKTLNEA